MTNFNELIERLDAISNEECFAMKPWQKIAAAGAIAAAGLGGSYKAGLNKGNNTGYIQGYKTAIEKSEKDLSDHYKESISKKQKLVMDTWWGSCIDLRPGSGDYVSTSDLKTMSRLDNLIKESIEKNDIDHAKTYAREFLLIGVKHAYASNLLYIRLLEQYPELPEDYLSKIWEDETVEYLERSLDDIDDHPLHKID